MPYYPPPSSGGSSSEQYVPGFFHNGVPREPRAGAWYSIPNGTGGPNATLTLHDTQIQAVGFAVAATPSIPLAGVRIYVTAAATAGIKARVAFYKATDDGVPTTFVADLGTNFIDTIGGKLCTTGLPTLTPGAWALCIIAVGGGGSGTIRGVGGGTSQKHGLIQAHEAMDNNTGNAATAINTTVGTAWPTTMPEPGVISVVAPRFGLQF